MVVEQIFSCSGEYHCILEVMKLFCGYERKKYFDAACLFALGFSQIWMLVQQEKVEENQKERNTRSFNY